MGALTKFGNGSFASTGRARNAAAVSLGPPAPKEIYLHPGQLYASCEQANISMILGSCVGLCLYDRVLSMGGATHYMLPKWVGTGKPSTRYGDVAINTLIKQFQLRGCKPSELQAMVFGGASMFQGGQGYQIGARNIEIAMHILDEHGIDVLTKNLGGERGRKIKMRTDIGTVSVRLIGNR